MSVLLLALTIGQTAKSEATPAPHLVLDRSFAPAIGQTGHVLSRDGSPILCAADRSGVDDVRKALLARDKIGIDGMIKSGEAVAISSATPMLVLEAGSGFTRQVRVPGTTQHVGQTTVDTWKVRFTEGELVGKTAYVPMENLGRLVETRASATRRKPKPDPPSPKVLMEREAGVAFRVAKALEAKKPLDAIKAYEKLATDFPDSDSARLAEARIKALKP